MRKVFNIETIMENAGPMNPVSYYDALFFLGLQDHPVLTPFEKKLLRAKKKKLINSSRKQDRRISREILHYQTWFC